RSAIADSTSTQPPASYICLSRLRTSGSLPGGGLSKRGPASPSDSMWFARTRSIARAHNAASDMSPRIVASDASCSSVRWKGDTDVAAKSPGIGWLAFQCPGFGRRLFGCFLRLGRKVRCEPVDDAALQRGSFVALADQLRRDVGAGDLIRIRVVDDDLA